MRIKKKSIFGLLCVLLLLSSLTFAGCDDKNNDIKDFYGVYDEPLYEYYTVGFYPQTENKNFALSHGIWKITGVNEDSFNYIGSSDQNLEKKCDEFLLKALKKMVLQLNSKVTVSKGLIYLNDSDVKIEYDEKRVQKTQGSVLIYDDKYNNFAGWYEDIKDGKKQIVFSLSLLDDYVIDENGVEWEIMVSKAFK